MGDSGHDDPGHDDSDGDADTGGADTQGSEGADGAGEATSGGRTSAGGERGGPKILSLDINVDAVGPGQAFTISAIVTDPDGVDDVIGGQLQSMDGDVVFASFETQAQEGAYSLVVSFEQLGLAQPGGGTSSGEDRVFRAEFFDQAGAVAWQTLDYRLQCDAGFFCDDRCLDVECIPGLAPCEAGATCWAGLCIPNGAGVLGSPCDVAGDCATWCQGGECLGDWCEVADSQCPLGLACGVLNIRRQGTPTCPLDTMGVCLPG